MKEPFNKETNQSWPMQQKDTSGGVFVVIDNNLGADIRKEEGAVTPIPGNEATIAQAWVNARGRMRVFSVYFWNSEGWTPRSGALTEAIVKQLRTTKHPQMIAGDANSSPEAFKKSLWFRSRHMFIEAPGEGISTYRSQGRKGEIMKITYDYVIASHGVWTWWKILNQDHTRR